MMHKSTVWQLCRKMPKTLQTTKFYALVRIPCIAILLPLMHCVEELCDSWSSRGSELSGQSSDGPTDSHVLTADETASPPTMSGFQ